MMGLVDAGAYWITVALGTGLGAAGCVAARAVGGRAARRIGRCIALVLAADALTFLLGAAFEGRWSARSSLPLNLCELLLAFLALRAGAGQPAGREDFGDRGEFFLADGGLAKVDDVVVRHVAPRV